MRRFLPAMVVTAAGAVVAFVAGANTARAQWAEFLWDSDCEDCFED